MLFYKRASGGRGVSEDTKIEGVVKSFSSNDAVTQKNSNTAQLIETGIKNLFLSKCVVFHGIFFLLLMNLLPFPVHLKQNNKH